MVIAKATDGTFDDAVHRCVLRPLGLTQTLTPADAEVMPEPHAHGYLDVDGRLADMAILNASQAGAAGGMVSTGTDLNRFFAALLTGGLLDLEGIQLMHADIPSLARVQLANGVTVWGKTGGAIGYHTVSFHTPDARRQLTVSMTLTSFTRPPTAELLASVAQIFAS